MTIDLLWLRGKRKESRRSPAKANGKLQHILSGALTATTDQDRGHGKHIHLGPLKKQPLFSMSFLSRYHLAHVHNPLLHSPSPFGSGQLKSVAGRQVVWIWTVKKLCPSSLLKTYFFWFKSTPYKSVSLYRKSPGCQLCVCPSSPCYKNSSSPREMSLVRATNWPCPVISSR